MKVKICGITRVEDLLAADRLGADYAGFVLAPSSKRFVPREQLAALGAAKVRLARVGVFVKASEDEIREAIVLGHLDVVQLYHCSYAAPGVEVWAATEDVAAPFAHRVIDGVQAGSGELCDWSIAAQWAAREPIVLAGGLNADNVRDAITAVKPWCVDGATGTEATPGIKDLTKLEAFIRKAKE